MISIFLEVLFIYGLYIYVLFVLINNVLLTTKYFHVSNLSVTYNYEWIVPFMWGIATVAWYC